MKRYFYPNLTEKMKRYNNCYAFRAGNNDIIIQVNKNKTLIFNNKNLKLNREKNKITSIKDKNNNLYIIKNKKIQH